MDLTKEKACPFCGFIRQKNKEYFCPDYECPQCQKVYNKAKINGQNNLPINKAKKQRNSLIENVFGKVNAFLSNKPTPTEKKEVRLKGYVGYEKEAYMSFHKDLSSMEAEGYSVIDKQYAQGVWGCGSILVGMLLIFFFGIGIFVLLYMLFRKPQGTLIVKYKLSSQSKMVSCPKCKEEIKEEAILCRYCQTELAPPS